MTAVASATPTAALFANLTDFGWVRLEAQGVRHWAEKNKVLCGVKPGPELHDVLGQDALSWNEHVGACPKCVSELVRREHALPFRVGQRVISRACCMVLRGKIVRFFLFNDNTPALDITREWARPPEEITVRGHDVFQNDTHPGDWYRAPHECKPLEEKPMTQTTTKKASAAAKNLPLKAKQSSGKKVKVPEVASISADVSAYGPVDTATCPETGRVYSVGDWVDYVILEQAMTGQILTMETQAPPFETVVTVPNHKLGKPWTKMLIELEPAQAPDTDQPLPASESDAVEVLSDDSSPTALELTPVDVVAVPVMALGDTAQNQIRAVPWNTIYNSRLNPRKHFEPDSLKELAVSIYRQGLQQNLVVRPHPERDGEYEIAAGERRWRAIGLLTKGFEVGEGETRDWLELPVSTLVNVLIQPMTDLELLQAATAENVQRRRMTPLEEADAFAGLIDLGSDVEDIAARFGYGRRTVVRRVQISRSLIQPIREKYDDGVLTLAQVEVLAVAGPETQEAVWSMMRGNPRAHTVNELRAAINRSVFLVKHRQFPPNWYTGAVVQDDLFGDVEPYLVDAKQAMELQLKHARHLADKDVEKGASFAAVELDSSLYKWGDGGSGVVYSMSDRTGELTRWDSMGPKRSSYAGYGNQPVHVAGDMAAITQKQGEIPGVPGSSAAPSQPVKPASARYPADWEVANLALDQVIGQAMSNPAHLEAIYLLNAIARQAELVSTPETAALLKAVADGSNGVLKLASERLGLPNNTGPEHFDTLAGLALEVLRDLPADQRTPLVYGYLAADVQDQMDEVGEFLAAQAGPFTLSERYLSSCNRTALLELWTDAGLTQENEANITDEYLRSTLLHEAAALQIQGFLPRPMREEVQA